MAPCWWKWWWGCWVDDGHHDDGEDYDGEDDDEDDDGHHDKGEDFIKHSWGHCRQTGLFSHLVEIRIRIVIDDQDIRRVGLFSDGLRDQNQNCYRDQNIKSVVFVLRWFEDHFQSFLTNPESTWTLDLLSKVSCKHHWISIGCQLLLIFCFFFFFST